MPKSKKSDSSESSSDSGPDDKIPQPAAKKSKSEPAKVKESAKDKMAKSKKRETSESNSDSDSGAGDNPEPPADKKSKNKSVKVAANEKGPWTLEGYRQVRINEFRGRKSVDIREFYEKDGQILPGKKGICLSVTQWLKLLEHTDEITAAVRDQ